MYCWMLYLMGKQGWTHTAMHTQGIGCCEIIKDICMETSLQKWDLVMGISAALCNLS